MKKVTLLAACFAAYSFGAQAQVVESAWMPSAGIAKNSFLSNNSADFSVGSAGQDQIWDFSGLTSSTSMTQNAVAASEGNGSAQFETASLAYVDGMSAYYFGTSNGAFQELGSYSGSDNQITSEVFNDAKDLLRFPVGFGQSFTDDFNSVNRSYTMSQPYEKAGSISVEVDGSGSLITPEGTFDNVLRVKSIETYQFIGLPPTPGSSTTGTITKYTYISPDYPGIFLLEHVTVDDNINPAQTDIYYADVVSLNTRFSPTRPEFVLYPNPTSNVLSIRSENPVTSIQLRDRYGRSVNYSIISRTDRLVEISVRDIPSGVYLIKIEDTQGQVVSRRINVQH